MKSMRIFITGGSGFLGKSVMRKLIKEGHELRALSRSQKSDKILKLLGAMPIRGDLLKVDSFSKSLKGCEAVIHCAAPVKFWGKWEEFSDGIIDSTVSLARIAQNFKIKKFIHISSESVLQNGKPLLGIDENYPYPAKANSFYGEAKKDTEMELMKIKGDMKIVMLRPPFIYGTDCPAYKELFQAVNSGAFKWVNGSNHAMEAIHVENLSHAIQLAVVKNIDDGVYLVSDHREYSAKEFFTKIFEENNIRVPVKSIPFIVLKTFAHVLTSLWGKLGIQSKPLLTLFDLDFIALPRSYKIDKFVKATGYKPVN